MTKFGLLGAAGVILSSALASPAMAQEVIYNPGYGAQFYPNANCQNKGPGTGSYQHRIVHRTYWTAMPVGTTGEIAAMIRASGPLTSRLVW